MHIFGSYANGLVLVGFHNSWYSKAEHMSNAKYNIVPIIP